MTTKQEPTGYQIHQVWRREAVREAVKYHGIQIGADPFRVEHACQEAEAEFRRDPSSGHRAIEWGRIWLDKPRNVIPMRRRG